MPYQRSGALHRKRRERPARCLALHRRGQSNRSGSCGRHDPPRSDASASHPEMGRCRPEWTDCIRSWPSTPYLLFYYPDKRRDHCSPSTASRPRHSVHRAVAEAVDVLLLRMLIELHIRAAFVRAGRRRFSTNYSRHPGRRRLDLLDAADVERSHSSAVLHQAQGVAALRGKTWKPSRTLFTAGATVEIDMPGA
jgi:hypothetical protein